MYYFYERKIEFKNSMVNNKKGGQSEDQPPPLIDFLTSSSSFWGKDVIRGSCMFMDNIFPNLFWIEFKRLSKKSHLYLKESFLEGFVNGSIGGLQMDD